MGQYFDFVNDNKFDIVMRYAKEHPFFTTKDISMNLGYNWLGAYLSRLEKQGYLKFTFRKNRMGQMIRVYYSAGKR